MIWDLKIVDMIFSLHSSEALTLSDMNGKCFLAAAATGHAKLLNKLKEKFCHENQEIGIEWFRQVCHRVSYRAKYIGTGMQRFLARI